MKTNSLKVPESMQALYDEITAMSDAFCKEHLNAEYLELARKMAATLARKRPSPLVNGQAKSWRLALFTRWDKSTSCLTNPTPHICAPMNCASAWAFPNKPPASSAKNPRHARYFSTAS